MLTPAFLRHNGGNSTSTASATLVAALLTDFPAHMLGLVRCASGALGGSNGASNEHTLTDSLGTVYTKVAEVTRQPEPFRTGVTVSLWSVRPAAVIPGGTLLTLTCGASVECLAMLMDTYDLGAAVNTLTLAGVAVDDGSTGGASDPAVTLTPSDWDDFLWVGTGAFDGAANLVIPVPGGWGQDGLVAINGGGNFDGLTLWGQSRIVEALQQTWTVAQGSDRRWGMILAAYSLQAPAVVLPVGGRQLKADFETGTQGYAGTSSSNRPDAVGVNSLVATSIGPSAIEDTGAQSFTWKARATAGQVFLCRRNGLNEDWSTESVLFTYSGAAIAEMFNGLTFDRNGRPVVCCERPTGTAGAPEVWLYWYDPDLADYTFALIDSGRTPMVVLDAFPHTGARCAPTPDVQLVYLKPAVGLVRRESRDRFVTLYVSSLPYVPNIWLAAYFPTATRKLVNVYWRRNRHNGEYDKRRIESLPFADSLLNRPDFQTSRQFDLTWYRGQLFTNPSSGPPTTEGYSLRIVTPDACDVIELQCANTAPSGVQADTGGIWTEQVQESAGPHSAGGSNDFTISVTHGSGSMNPNTFRTRIRKQIGSVTCYSPWRYFIAAAWGTPVSWPTTAVNCGHDVVVTIPVGAEFGSGNLGPHYCDGEGHVDPGSSGGGAFVGGWDTGAGGWRQDWSAQLRTRGLLNFSDPDMVFAGVLVGAVYDGAGGGNGWPMSDPDQSPLQIP